VLSEDRKQRLALTCLWWWWLVSGRVDHGSGAQVAGDAWTRLVPALGPIARYSTPTPVGLQAPAKVVVGFSHRHQSHSVICAYSSLGIRVQHFTNGYDHGTARGLVIAGHCGQRTV